MSLNPLDDTECQNSAYDRSTMGNFVKLQELCNDLQSPLRVKMLELPSGTQTLVKPFCKAYLPVNMQREQLFEIGYT